jgi:uncharacterized protein (TIGR02147 family)
MKSIFYYTLYRTFLKDRLVATKENNPKMNLGVFAKKMGLSQSSLNMILSGQRNLTVENIFSVAKFLKLSPVEHDYFENMVLRDQSEEGTPHRRYYEVKLKKIRRFAKIENISVTDKTLLSNWRIPALLIYLMDRKRQPSEELSQDEIRHIANRIQLPGKEIEKLMQKFFKSGLLSYTSDKQLHIEFDKLSSKISQKNYVSSIHGEFQKRVDEIFDDQNSIYRGFVFSLRKEAIPNFRDDILALYERYMADIDKDVRKNILVQSIAGMFPVIDFLGAPNSGIIRSNVQD